MAARRALVQDDQNMFSGPGSVLIKGQGFEVDIAQNGAQGIELMKANKYDIVFSDVEMPNMNGFEFLSRVSKDPGLKTVPVVMCTTLNKPEHIEMAKKLGAKGYIVKPMTKDALIAALKHLKLT